MSSSGVKYVGHRHFDWSWLQIHYPRHRVLIVLRDPVSRAISQFYFSKKLQWTRGMAIRGQTIDEYLLDYKSMLATRGVWQDGEAGASWIAGTHIASWVAKNKGFTIDAREKLERDSATMCSIIEKRIRGAFWVGFLDTLDTDMARLGTMIGAPLHIGKHNTNPHPSSSSRQARLKIQALTTLDHWMYRNAKQLSADRKHVFSPCPLHHPCRSTRFSLECTKTSPFGRVSYGRQTTQWAGALLGIRQF